MAWLICSNASLAINRTYIQNVFFLLHSMLAVALASSAGFARSSDEIPNSYIVTFGLGQGVSRSPVLPAVRRATPPAFGEHSSGQDKRQLAEAMGVHGTVKSIFDSANAAHFLVDEEDAERLRKDPRVLHVERNVRLSISTSAVQTNPGWALDRMDQPTVALNNLFAYNANGAGQTIYILDTGLSLANAQVAAEFGGRASIFYDYNGGDGRDCDGHGSMVASAAAGKTYGIARGATLKIVKITGGCTGVSEATDWMAALNWLAANAPRGTIVNLSSNLPTKNCEPATNEALNASIKAAHDSGVIVVISAGNDGCSTDNQAMTNSPFAFVVGATTSGYFNGGYGFDAKASFSRYGSNVSAYAPGHDVAVMNLYGLPAVSWGTSFSAPYIAGMFAVACQYYGGCNTMSDASVAYNGLRAFGLDIVFSSDGKYILPNRAGRFISKPAAWN